MIELAQHIESLLLENDCVIVPGLGGFIAHYNPSIQMKDEHLFLPPTRIIGFNPLLKMNDGLLVQSYMTAYDTNFPDATRRVEREVERLTDMLHEEGKATLPHIGELSCSLRGTYDFTPYDNRLTTPSLYGLDCFEMQELDSENDVNCREALHSVQISKESHDGDAEAIHSVPASDVPAKTRIIPYKKIAAAAAAVAALLVLVFFLSSPVENTRIMKENFARLLPDGLFEQTDKPAAKRRKKPVKPLAVREVKVPKSETANSEKPKVEPAPAEPKAQQADPTPTLAYHIIVASLRTERDAQAMAQQLVEKGHTAARAIIGDGKMRVCIQSFATEAEAYRALNQVRETVTEQAWVLKK